MDLKPNTWRDVRLSPKNDQIFINMERDEALNWIKTDVKSDDFYKLLSLSNKQSRTQFGNRGYVFAQIGMNA